MEESKFVGVKFPKEAKDGFSKVLKQRVSEYFKTKNKQRSADYRMWIKIVLLPLFYITPFVLMLTGVLGNAIWLQYVLWFWMGIGVAGCGLGIMHDAAHGAVSTNKTVNRIVAAVLNLTGGHVLNWQIQHNVLHHSYTNIDGIDEDLDPSGLMRFCPNQPVKGFYKYQHIYGWFVYGLMTFFWTTFKDFVQLKRYNQMGLVKAQGTSYGVELFKVISLKIIYFLVFVGLPLLILDTPWYHILLGWFLMQFVAGLCLALIFQPAHIVPENQFPIPDNNNTMEDDRMIHQLVTTSNFAPNNKPLTWFVGGLNFQIEHHLFPNMCHIHHKDISVIVEKTAKEFGLPYHTQPTFRAAIVNHAKMLYKLRK